MEENKEKKTSNRLIDFIKKMWEIEAIRFIFVGGVNTLIGILFTMLLRFIFTKVHWNPEILVIYFSKASHSFSFSKTIIEDTLDTQILFVDIPYIINFVALLPLAYTMHAKIGFRTAWSWRKLAVYPLSSIPNLILTSLFICLFSGICGINPYISYILAPLLALPIMFFIIRFLVKPLKKKTPKVEE